MGGDEHTVHADAIDHRIGPVPQDGHLVVDPNPPGTDEVLDAAT